MWDNYPNHLKKIYWKHKRVLWTGAYFFVSCGGVTIDQLKKYGSSVCLMQRTGLQGIKLL